MRTMTKGMRPNGKYMYVKELGTVWLMGSNENVALDGSGSSPNGEAPVHSRDFFFK